MNKKFLASVLALTMTFGTLAAPVGESILTDNAVSVSAAKSVSETDRMRSAYRKILKNAIDNPGINPTIKNDNTECPVAEHTVYDIDKNGVPELIIRFESFHFNQYMKIYSYNTKKHKAYLLKNISTSGRLEKDARSGSLMIQGAQMGYCFFNKIQLKNNKISIKSLKGVNSPAGDLKPDGTRVTTQEYKKIVEKFVIPAPITKISGEKLIKNCYTDSSLKYHQGTEQYVDSDYLINHSKITTKKTSAKVTLSKQKITKVKSGKNYIKVAWKRNKKASGYQLKLCSNKKFKGGKIVKITKNKTTAKTIKKLKSNKKYYAKVRSYKKVGKKVYYGKWSAVKAVRTKSAKKSKAAFNKTELKNAFRKIISDYANEKDSMGYINQSFSYTTYDVNKDGMPELITAGGGRGGPAKDAAIYFYNKKTKKAEKSALIIGGEHFEKDIKTGNFVIEDIYGGPTIYLYMVKGSGKNLYVKNEEIPWNDSYGTPDEVKKTMFRIRDSYVKVQSLSQVYISRDYSTKQISSKVIKLNVYDMTYISDNTSGKKVNMYYLIDRCC